MEPSGADNPQSGLDYQLKPDLEPVDSELPEIRLEMLQGNDYAKAFAREPTKNADGDAPGRHAAPFFLPKLYSTACSRGRSGRPRTLPTSGWWMI